MKTYCLRVFFASVVGATMASGCALIWEASTPEIVGWALFVGALFAGLEALS